MKNLTLVLVLVCCSRIASSQNVKLASLDQLYARIKAGGDTTYVVNFWATWCVPCIRELPNFEEVQTKYKTGAVKVLLVSVDFQSRLKSSVVPFVRKHHLKSEVLLLSEANQQAYIDRVDPSWSGTIPATLFIHKGNRIFLEKEFTTQQIIDQIQRIK